MKHLLLAILIKIITGCKEEQLTKLSDEQYMELINQKLFTQSDDIAMANELGNIISKDSVKTLFRYNDFKDLAVVNKEGLIKKIVRLDKNSLLKIIRLFCIFNQLDRIERTLVLLYPKHFYYFSPN